MSSKQTKTTGARRHLRPDGTWNIDAMTKADFDELAADCEKLTPGSGRPMTKRERARFDAWQKKALAEETSRMTLVFPKAMADQIGKLAKAKRITPEHLLQHLVESALQRAVA